MKKSFFTERQVDISAILAGPIPPGILIYQNYKALGKEKEAYRAIAATFIFTILFFFGILNLPAEVIDKVPNFAFTALYGIIVFVFFRHFMAKDVERAFEDGAIKRSNWSVAGFTVLGLIINLALVFGLSLGNPLYEGKMIEIQGNQLYHDPNIPQEDIDKFNNQLIYYDFFGDNYGNVARLQINEEAYLITLLVDEEFWSDQQLLISLGSLKLLMESEFERPTKLRLESMSLRGTSKFKDL